MPVSGKGIVEYSPLLDLEYPFDIIFDVPADEFHLCKEGLTKQMLVRIFKGTSQAATEVTAKLNRFYMAMQTFSETPRRSRHVKYVNKFKGSELGVLLLSAMPALFKDCIPEGVGHWQVYNCFNGK